MDSSELLSPADLATLEDFELIARTVVNGFLAGLHRSLYQGFGIEFVQYRNYSPGDDLRYMDWKIMGKTDRPFIKIFQEETNLDCQIVLDMSGSMNYEGKDTTPKSSKNVSKALYAKMCAACLAWLIHLQGDNVGLTAYSEDLITHIEAGHRMGVMENILSSLSTMVPGKMANHTRALDFLAETLRRRGIVIFISDLLNEEDQLLQSLRQIKYKHHDCMVFQVLHSDEISFPFEGSRRFVDSETGMEIATTPETIKDNYLKNMNEFLKKIKDDCHSFEMDYLLLDTSQPLNLALSSFLHRRNMLQ